LTGITDAASAKAAQLKLLDVDYALDHSWDLWNQVPVAESLLIARHYELVAHRG